MPESMQYQRLMKIWIMALYCISGQAGKAFDVDARTLKSNLLKHRYTVKSVDLPPLFI